MTRNIILNEKQLKNYKKQVRADAIDDFVNALLYGRDKAGVEILVFSKDAREKLLKMAEQLKEQGNENERV